MRYYNQMLEIQFRYFYQNTIFKLFRVKGKSVSRLMLSKYIYKMAYLTLSILT